ncbi:MAG: RHS repeat-associated core domain-containing protein [Candidatus Acidiferrales bacterium]
MPNGAEAGVMIRETLDTGGAETFSYFISGSSFYEYMSDRTFDGSVVSGTEGSAVTAPYWVQVVRNANQFSAYVSADGITWVQLGTTQTIASGETVYVGLAVSSRTPGTLATATLDNVSISTGTSVANPVVTGLSPAAGAPGQSVTVSGSGFGATQNGGTVTFNGAAATVTSWSDSQIVVVVPDEATSGSVSVTAGGISAGGVQFIIQFQAQVTDSLGNQTTYTSEPFGGQWELSSSQGSGCSTCTTRGNYQFQYDGSGNRVGATDPNGNIVMYANDSTGDVTAQVAVLNSTPVTTTYTYNSFGEVLTMTDPLGNVTTNTYDSHGNLLTVTTPKPNSNTAASETQFTYNSVGELTQITDPLSRVTKIAYTTTGYIASITDPQNNVTSYTYDSRGNRTSLTDAMNNQTTFTYDMGNRLTGITYPDQSTASFTYDYRGRRITATDQNGKTTTYGYDLADRLTSVTDPVGNVTEYSYDTEGNLLSITDTNSHTTSFGYDAFGRVTQTTFPSNYSETYGYDADNNLTSKKDRNGNTIQYVYDALSRLTQKTYPDSTTAEYTYDLVGKILQVNDPSGMYAFAYDNMGRLIGTTTTYSFLPNTQFSNSYTYDADSNRTGFTAPDGSTNTYTYDTLNRLTTLANSWAGSFGFSYDALSRRTQMTRPNSITTNYSYNQLSRLLSVLHQSGSSTIDGASYTLDSVGNRTASTNQLSGVTSNYTYDKIYELTQVTQGNNTTESYSFDPVGNRTASLAIPSYTVNSSNELTSDSNASYTHDNNGNTTSETNSTGTTNYTWNFDNRLTQVTLPNSGGTVNFEYDPFGRRIEKVSPTATSIFVYDGDNLVETVNGSGGEVASYAQGQDIDEPLAMDRSGTIDYYEQDGLGSVTSLTVANGSVVQSYTYDSFGNTTNSSGSLTNFFRYTGRELDTETNLYFYRARYYDPTTGRFLGEDPIQFEGDINFYVYVVNDPVDGTDPFGLKCMRKLMLVTAYSVHKPGSDWPYFAPKRRGDQPSDAGLGTVAVANTNPPPYPYGTTVSVSNNPDPFGSDFPLSGPDYWGTVHDTGRGWDYPGHTPVPPDDWIDIWLPSKAVANKWGRQWRWVTICTPDTPCDSGPDLLKQFNFGASPF